MCIELYCIVLCYWANKTTKQELVIAWSGADFPRGNIQSYQYAVKVDLTNANPSLWTFTGSAYGSAACTDWLSLNTTCIFGAYKNMEKTAVMLRQS